MLETVAIPILLKAVEFLFGEGSKILEECRERRKTQQEIDKGKAEKDSVPTTLDKSKSAGIIQSKEAALSQPVFENVWSASEARVKHLLSMLEIYTKNYYLAKEKHAKWGTALVPPIVTHELTEAANGVVETVKELRDILSTVYNKPVVVLGIDQNEKSS
jgi:hypothetical protein